MNQAGIPFYDFPHSPILWIGLGGILFTLVLYFVTNRAYTISPFNEDNELRQK
jgi:hypothetical protein